MALLQEEVGKMEVIIVKTAIRRRRRARWRRL